APHRHDPARRPVPAPAGALAIPCAGRIRLQGDPEARLRAAEPPARAGAGAGHAGPCRPHGRRLRARGGRAGIGRSGRSMIRVELVKAWPRRHRMATVELAEGSTVGDALAAAGWVLDAEFVGLAVFGQATTLATAVRDGDRVELLRGLQLDPKQARRLRAERAKTKP